MLTWRVLCLGAAGVLIVTACGVGSGIGDDDGVQGGATATGGTGGAGSGTGTGGVVGVGGTGTGGSILVGGSAGTPECVPETGPYCGDGMVNVAGETCDDGNAVPGDGCTGVCVAEPFFLCPAAGGPCVSTLRCGDGMRSPGEACDDGNNAGTDGCAGDCSTVEPGWYCPMQGAPCMHSEGVCGDSRVQ